MESRTMTTTPPENTEPAAPEPTAGAIGTATAAAVAQVLSPWVMKLAEILAQIPQVITSTAPIRQMCARCLAERIAWEQAHRAEMEAAFGMACKHAGITREDPRAAGVDVSPFLPVRLHPASGGPEAMPQIQNAATIHQGNALCPGHLGQPNGAPRLLAVTGSFTPAMLAGIPT
jgi:hypothetical protein